jgi:demethylspheroidene O-methyltransferase
MIGNPGIAAMVEHHAMLYADLADPVELLRRERGGTALAQYWAYAGAAQPGALPGEKVSDYTALMAASQPMVAQEVLAAYRFGQHRRLMDVGGGSGAFLTAVGKANPRLDLLLFDLPAVAEQGLHRFAREGLSDRAMAMGGDFTTDSLPLGADIISLVRVLHDHDDDVVRALLRKAHAALPPSGRLLLAEPMAGTMGAEVMGDAYFGLYMWAMGSGRPRTVAAYLVLLAEAGFGSAREVATALPMVTRLIVAQR